MKNLLLFALLIITNLSPIIGQVSRFDKEREARGYRSPVTPIKTAQLVNDKSRIGIGEDEKLTFLSVRQDKLGYTHTRYQQYYKDIEVEGATYIIHEKNGKVESANGGLIQHLDINTIPAISEMQALQIAANHIDITDADVKLLIFDKKYTRNPNNYDLAYRITDKDQHTSIYAHAHTGEIITTINCRHHGDVPGTGIGAYYGSVDITVDDQNGVYVLKDNGRDIQVFYANNDGGTTYSEDSIITDTDTHFDNAPHAVDAFWSLQATYDYFSNNHELESYENGEPIRAWVNLNLSNAYWNGSNLVFGNGFNNPNRSHYTSMDMVVHEYLHAIIQRVNSANFILSDDSEAGSLSESYPDMFAAVIESIYLPDEDNWIIGERIVTENGKNGIRNLQNPHDPTMTRPMAAHFDEFSTNKYYNSGISSHAFYLMTNSTGIDSAAQIAYQALSYMSSNAQFIDARVAMITTAELLYGINSNAAQQTAAAWYAVGIGNNYSDNVSSCRERDSLSLLAIYNATDGDNWTRKWDLSLPIDEWRGIKVNEDGCVTCIELEWVLGCDPVWAGGNNLVGTIPPEIGDFESLEGLFMSGNDFSGGIPPEIGKLTNLTHLAIAGSSLSGPIPPEIGNLTNLVYLNMYGNNLNGSLPPEMGSLINLEIISLSFNSIEGDIPPQLGNLTNLWSLNLAYNRLTGQIPASFGYLENLTALKLKSNYLDGCYPPTLTNLCNRLDSVHNTNEWISNNTGLPSWEDFCANNDNVCFPINEECRLQDSLALIAIYNATDGDNWTRKWDLSLPIDEWRGIGVNEVGCVTCIELEWVLGCDPVWAGGNNLVGTIPPEIGNFGSLEGLFMSGNSGLVGSIPPEIGNLVHLKSLSIAGCGLSGEIPPEIGNLSNLEYIDLYSNHLTRIPPEISNATNLEEIHLSFNPIEGSLPPEIANLTKLRHFGCNFSKLSGNIPAEFGNLENLTYLGLKGNYMTGCYYPNLANLCSQLDTLSEFDYELPSWEEFCNTGAGSCAPLTCAQTDSLALVAFYNSTNGADWTNPWDLTQPMSTWQGVSIVDGCVTKLILSGRGLSGTLAPEIGDLQSLSHLNLDNNDIGGNIPVEMGNMVSLTLLSMANNEFTDTIPKEIGNLNELYHLHLNGNNLNGSIPEEIGNLVKLTWLGLGRNPITGSIPIEIGNLIELKELYLHRCNLTDTIPKELGSLLNLEKLFLENNELTGIIPIEFGNLTKMSWLYLGSNELSGSIPVEFGNLTELFRLFLEGNNLTGGIPSSFGNLDKLDDLKLTGNPLGGSIPPEFGSMDKLRLLWMHGCELTGAIPPELGNSPRLYYFFANNNHLSGSIPPELGSVSTLGSIQLEGNELTGNIPPELGNLSNLATLHLGGNNFTGSIPKELGQLKKLYDLFLYGNDMTGSLPLELAGMEAMSRFWLQGNNFSGDVPIEIAQLPGLSDFWLHGNKFTFKSLEPIKYIYPSFTYANQDTIIPTIALGNQLSVDAGGTVAYNTYKWYRDGTLAATIVGDSTYTPDIAGTYYCKISNSVLTQSYYHHNFVLRSADLDFAPSSLPVYPGDFNADGIVDNFDAIIWGWASGQQGVARDNTGTAWGPYVVDDWMYSVAGVNNKHQDGDGNGIINQDDLQAIIANYDSIRPIVSSNRMGLFPEDYILEFELVEETYTDDNKISRRYNVYLRHIDEEPVVVHGVAFDVAYTGFDEAPDIRIDTTNSSLGDSLGLVEVFNPSSKIFSVGISQQDQSPDTLTGPVAQFVLDEIWQGGENRSFTLFNSPGGIVNVSEDENYPVGGQEVMVSPNIPGGESSTLAHAVATQPTCERFGNIEIQPVNNDAAYTYAWSHDSSNSTNTATGLDPGVYDVTVTEAGKQPAVFEVVLRLSESCVNDVLLGIDAILEGAYQHDSTIVMKESLLNGALIPKINPYTGYHSALSTILETEGENAPVDWLLIELRDINDWGTTIYEAPVLLQRNGRLVNADGTYPIRLTPPDKIDSFYLVIKHRNHLPIMYENILEGTYNRVDFTKSDSYNADGTGTGQKEISDDVWVMVVGNADDDIYDINGNDKIRWSEDNGDFGFYLDTDFNLDGDVNGKDKIFWKGNNGTFSAIPQPE